MTKAWITSEVAYWVIVLAVYLWLTWDGPPSRSVAWWYHVAQWAQWTSYQVGRVGLYAERQYHREVESLHG